MTVARAASANDLGAAMLDWAARQAVAHGKKWLRCDAWANNTALHNYYRQLGFQQLRTRHFAHRGSGALF